MDLSPFAVTLLVVTLPVLGLLVFVAWLVERRVDRIRVVDSHGRSVAEVVLGHDPAGD